MRGPESSQSAMFSYVSLEERIPESHPLREIRSMTDAALKRLSRRFGSLYAKTGRPSVPPEQLLRGLLLQALYTIRSERQLMEQLEYNLLFRWFVGLSMDDQVWSATVYTKNRDRLLHGDVAQAFFTAVIAQAEETGLLSAEHFTVDGTLIEAWASHKSFQRKDGKDDDGDGTNFHGSRRKNETHESKTDPDSRLFRKGYGKEAKLNYMGHVLMENRNGLVVDARLTQATGRAEWEAALEMAKRIPGQRRVTLGADKGYDTPDLVESLRELGITPHVARKKSGGGIDDRTTRHVGYEISQLKRKLVEPVFGWLKVVGNLRKTRHRGRPKVGWMFLFGLAAYNLVRIGNLRCST